MFSFVNIKRHLTGREKIITLPAAIITLLFGGVLFFSFASAMTYQDEVNVQFTFEPSLSISLSSPNLIISNLVPGNYSNSNTITVNVNTNNVTGYTLTAKVGGTGQTSATNNLVNSLANTNFASLNDDANIPLPNFADNKWGYSTAASITDATTFSGLLYNEDKVINATTNYDGTAATGYTGTSSTNFTIGAKASADQAAGDYTNVITFTAVTNAAPSVCGSDYAITFKTSNANSIVFNGVSYANNDVACMPAGTYHIYGNYATRYAFSSWTITAGTLENSTYQNTAYTVTGDATITLTGQQVTTAIQNLPSSSCTTTATPVYDNRDDSVYWIQKLPDNNCWMLDNLALDLTSSTIVNVLSTTNTHLDATSLTYFKNGGGTSSDRYPITAYDAFDSDNIYSQPRTNVESKNITLRPSTATNYTDSIADAYGLGQGKIGAYYNYCAASVGYYCFGDGTSAGTSSGNNDYDICPAGWRMPTGNSSGEYNTLYTTSEINSDATTYRNTLSTPLSGRFHSGSAYNRGSYGYFWSSTRYNNSGMYRLFVDSSSVFSTYSDIRGYGISVRCILGS